MKAYTLLLTSILFSTLVSAQGSRSLSEFKQTEFVSTLDHEIHSGKNVIYSPTLLYAWNSLRELLKGQVQVDSAYRDLYLLNQSKDYEKTLLGSDYDASAKIFGDQRTDGLIRMKARFEKSLPLFRPMASFDNELDFNGKKVPAFGGTEEVHSADIRFYRDDNNFVIGLTLENPWHEILLYKTESSFRSLNDVLKALRKNIKAGEDELMSGRSSWKFDIGKEDKLLIPKVNFDIKTNYPTMEGKKIESMGKRLIVDKVSQQTAFALDENGAKIESEGVGEVVFEESVQEEPGKPKKLFFDKPFFIIVKRKESVNPYLVLWIVNTELMK